MSFVYDLVVQPAPVGPTTQTINFNLGGLIPKAVIAMSTRNFTVDDTPLVNTQLSYGFTDGSNQHSVYGYSQDGVSSQNTRMGHSNFSLIEARNGGGNILMRGNFSSWAADSMNVSWVLNTQGQINVVYLALAGTDLDAVVGNLTGLAQDTPSTITTGHESDLILTWGDQGIGGVPTDGNGRSLGFGGVVNDRAGGVKQESFYHHARDGLSTSEVGGRTQPNAGHVNGVVNDGLMWWHEYSNFTSTGFDVTLRNESFDTNPPFLSLNFGSSGRTADIQFIQTPTTIGPQTYSSFPFKPEIMFGMFTGFPALDTRYQNQYAGMGETSIITPNAQYSTGNWEEVGAGTMNTRNYLISRVSSMYDHDGTQIIDATHTQFENNGFTWDFAQADPTARHWLILAISEAPGAPPIGLLEVVNETQEIIDKRQIRRGLNRFASEVVNIPEVVLASKVLLRVIDETVSIIENILPTRTLSRIVAETVNIPENVPRLMDITRTVSDVTTIVENVTRSLAKGLTEVISETVSIPENIVYRVAAGLIEIVNEIVNIPESTLRALGFVRVLDETVNIQEVVSTIRGMTKVVTETVWVDEIIVKARTMARTISESVNIAEVASRIMGMVEVINETVNSIETIIDIIVSGVTAIIEVINERVNIQETIQDLSGISQVISEALNINENMTRAMSLVRRVTARVRLVEVITRSGSLTRVIDESTLIVEGIRRVLGMVEVIVENVTLPETIAYRVAAFVGAVSKHIFKSMDKGSAKRMQ